MADPEVNEHDLADQQRPAWPTDDLEEPQLVAGIPVEADPADVLEQHREVPPADDDDDYVE